MVEGEGLKNGSQPRHWRPLMHRIAEALEFSPEELLEYLSCRAGVEVRLATQQATWSHSVWNLRFRVFLDYYIRAVQLQEEQKMSGVVSILIGDH